MHDHAYSRRMKFTLNSGGFKDSQAPNKPFVERDYDYALHCTYIDLIL